MRPGIGRPAFWVALWLAIVALWGCSRYSARIEVPAPIVTLEPFATSFAADPSIANWNAVHRRMQPGALDVASRTAIVAGLTRGRPISLRLLDAVAVDLATYDWDGSLETIRGENLRAQRAGARDAVSRTARLAWLMLALRADYVDERVDLAGMDLRDPSAFVGRSMNLTAADFSAGRLRGATWHASDLRRTSFERVSVQSGTLTCDECIWNDARTPSDKRFAGGRWIR